MLWVSGISHSSALQPPHPPLPFCAHTTYIIVFHHIPLINLMGLMTLALLQVPLFDCSPQMPPLSAAA